MKMKNHHIQNSISFFKLEYTRTSKDYFDIILGVIASLFCLLAFCFLIYTIILIDFSWVELFICGLFGFGAFVSISYVLVRWSDTARHLLYFDKIAQEITIRHSIFSNAFWFNKMSCE